DVLTESKAIHTKLGYPCYEVSALQGMNIEAIKALLRRRTTLVLGDSGVGKSTLINAIHPAAKMKTAAISDWSDKGHHTTTFAERVLVAGGGRLMDEPGIRVLGIINIEPQQSGHFLPQMRERMDGCRFTDCRHLNEPGCAVLAGLDAGAIAPSRYDSYLSIYHGNDTRL